MPEFEIHSNFHDEVIESNVCVGYVTYRYALENLLPLVDRFDAQRKIQNKKFYERLKADIISGCVMPAITIAIVSKEKSDRDANDVGQFALDSIGDGYILDGLQRLNTLQAAATDTEQPGFDADRPLPVNIIVAPTEDKLIYRMITLNNGQKPMTARHQIEILTQSMFSTRELENISIKTEKDTEGKKFKNALHLASISKAYIAYMTGSPNNDNRKIIEEKMDEILVGKILERGALDSNHDFMKTIELIDKFCEQGENFEWFKVENNIVAFSAAASTTFDTLSNLTADETKDHLEKIDGVIASFDVSKINLGKIRREIVFNYFSKFDELGEYSEFDLLEYFAEQTQS